MEVIKRSKGGTKICVERYMYTRSCTRKRGKKKEKNNGNFQRKGAEIVEEV